MVGGNGSELFIRSYCQRLHGLYSLCACQRDDQRLLLSLLCRLIGDIYCDTNQRRYNARLSVEGQWSECRYKQCDLHVRASQQRPGYLRSDFKRSMHYRKSCNLQHDHHAGLSHIVAGFSFLQPVCLQQRDSGGTDGHSSVERNLTGLPVAELSG